MLNQHFNPSSSLLGCNFGNLDLMLCIYLGKGIFDCPILIKGSQIVFFSILVILWGLSESDTHWFFQLYYPPVLFFIILTLLHRGWWPLFPPYMITCAWFHCLTRLLTFDVSMSLLLRGGWKVQWRQSTLVNWMKCSVKTLGHSRQNVVCITAKMSLLVWMKMYIRRIISHLKNTNIKLKSCLVQDHFIIINVLNHNHLFNIEKILWGSNQCVLLISFI